MSSSGGIGDRDGARLERAGDRLAVKHGFAKDRQNPSSTARTSVRKRYRHGEVNVADFTTSSLITGAMSPEVIDRLVQRAVEAALTVEEAEIWILHEIGRSNLQIAQDLNIHRHTVAARLTCARHKLWDYIDTSESWYRVYWSETARVSYQSRPPKQKVAPDLRHAREILEEQHSCETMILQDDQAAVDHLRVRVKFSKDDDYTLLTEQQVIELANQGYTTLTTAQTGERRNRRLDLKCA